MPKKPFIQKVETRRAIFTGLFVALFVLVAEAVKSTIEFLVHKGLIDLGVGDNNLSTGIGFIIAGIMLVFFIWIFIDVAEED